jgi:NADH:ubiquinone oxidoreductase subunit 2 (subunit N)
LVPRTLTLCTLALALSILRQEAPGLKLKDVKGMGRIWPFAASGLGLSILALAGLPLLAGFPAHQAVWEALAPISLPLTSWVFVGSIGLFVSAVRILHALTITHPKTTWDIRETPGQRLLVGAGILGLFLLGLFPQWALPLWIKLPAILEHFTK